MLKTEIIAPGVLKIVAPETLHAEDFLALAPQVDAIIKDFGEIRLLIDASRLEGWDSLAAIEKHAGFVKAHQEKVSRVAVIARRDWQHWLARREGVSPSGSQDLRPRARERCAAMDREGRSERRGHRRR